MTKQAYRAFYDRHAKFYRDRPWAAKLLRGVNYALTVAVFCAYVALLIVQIVQEDYLNFIWSCEVVLGCFFAVLLCRKLFNRKRPYDPNGAAITPIFRKLKSSDQSFPSRHLAMTFAIAGITLSASLVGGIALYVTGAVLGYVRFAAGLHYPTDLIAGGAIGTGLGLLVFIA
jgi:undecaprenyl-diphosphatase